MRGGSELICAGMNGCRGSELMRGGSELMRAGRN